MNPLDQLAARLGIQNSSLDAFGNEHHTTPELKRALLNAMRIPVDHDGAAKKVLDDLDAREWERPLPPVVVAYVNPDSPDQAGKVSVPLSMPAETGRIRWTVTLEDGGACSGEIRFPDLPLLASRDQHEPRLERRLLELDASLPWGYHRLQIEEGGQSMPVIVTPGRCWLPPQADERRLWGAAANVYLLRSDHNWGIGDFTDLKELAAILRDRGADALGINPLHAMFADKPEDASPYSPSDRLLLNILNIDVEAIPEFAHCDKAREMLATPDFQQELAAAQSAALVDYRAVAELKFAVLPLLFDTFEEQAPAARRRELEAFHEERRELLDRACVFQALRSHFTQQDASLSDCSKWPEEYRAASSPAVATFASEHAREVRYQLWLQWIADSQLKAAAEAAQGMAVGLYRDLAVGAHPTGAEVWTHPDALVSGAHVGAPPDILNTAGQNWGLPPLHPINAREQAYSSFTELVRANMRYAGGLRIDHAMALLRLYWIPADHDAKDGAYVHYPIDDLIGILALESQKNHCLVVGEALGTVPKGFRERMAEAQILAYSVLFFEVEEDEFLPPEAYPYLGLSVASNHDLATVWGWWQASDLHLREKLGLFPKGAQEARDERASSRESLIRALRAQGLLSERVTSAGEVSVEQYSEAVHRFLARSNCLLTLVQLEDITGELEQVNVPATSDQHPNWRKRLPLTLRELAADPRLAHMVELMRNEREFATRSHPVQEAAVAS